MTPYETYRMMRALLGELMLHDLCRDDEEAAQVASLIIQRLRRDCAGTTL